MAVTSGANISFDRLRLLAERALLGNRTEALLATRMADSPGAMGRLHAALEGRAVTELSYRASGGKEGGDGMANIFVSVSLDWEAGAGAADDKRGEGEVAAILASLAKAGIGAHDMSDNELAKSHMRYMAGGFKVSGRGHWRAMLGARAPLRLRRAACPQPLPSARLACPCAQPLGGERLIRFDFPEQPGALKKFLHTCAQRRQTRPTRETQHRAPRPVR